MQTVTEMHGLVNCRLRRRRFLPTNHTTSVRRTESPNRRANSINIHFQDGIFLAEKLHLLLVPQYRHKTAPRRFASHIDHVLDRVQRTCQRSYLSRNNHSNKVRIISGAFDLTRQKRLRKYSKASCAAHYFFPACVDLNVLK